jgi:hypothetical protein
MPWFTEEDVILTQLHYHRSPSLLYNVTQYNQQICIRVELSIVFNTRLTKLIGRLSYSFLHQPRGKTRFVFDSPITIKVQQCNGRLCGTYWHCQEWLKLCIFYKHIMAKAAITVHVRVVYS